MKAERCREWRESLGAYALSQLPEEARIALEAHLEGCPDCRAELEAIASVAKLMPLADPDRFGAASVPPPALADQVMAAIGTERRAGRRRRVRFGLRSAGPPRRRSQRPWPFSSSRQRRRPDPSATFPSNHCPPG